MGKAYFTALILLTAFMPRAMADGSAAQPSRTMVAPDIRPAALWDGRRVYAFHAADRPRMVSPSEARFLADDEYVLGVTVNGESRAYPTRFMAWHHVVNDMIGRRGCGGVSAVTLTYCVVCNTGVLFDPVVEGKALHFDFYGLYNGVMTMYDRETNSVWFQVGGRAVKGPLTGKELKGSGALNTTWRRWRELHPDTRVMAPLPEHRLDYEPNGTIVDRGFSSFPAPYFRRTLTRRDNRLAAFEMVIAIVDAGAGKVRSCRAYPLRQLKSGSGVVYDTVGAQPVVVLFERSGETATALSPLLDGRRLTLVRRGRAGNAFYDRETGSRWTVEGRAVAGPLAGRQLARLDSTLSEWYGWAAYFPQTSIYGQPAHAATACPPHRARNIAAN